MYAIRSYYAGFSMTQLIETSCITAHFANSMDQAEIASIADTKKLARASGSGKGKKNFFRG